MSAPGGNGTSRPRPEVADLLADYDPELSDREGWLHHADGRPFTAGEAELFHSAGVPEHLAAAKIIRHVRSRADEIDVATRRMMHLSQPSYQWHPQWLFRSRWHRWRELETLMLSLIREPAQPTYAGNMRRMEENAAVKAAAFRRLIVPVLHWRRRREALDILARLDPSGPEALAAAGHKARSTTRNRARP